MNTTKDAYVPVSCMKCGINVGYVVATGHLHWLCEECGDGKFIAVDSVGRELTDSTTAIITDAEPSLEDAGEQL